jgi:hypothetical protein
MSESGNSGRRTRNHFSGRAENVVQAGAVHNLHVSGDYIQNDQGKARMVPFFGSWREDGLSDSLPGLTWKLASDGSFSVAVAPERETWAKMRAGLMVKSWRGRWTIFSSDTHGECIELRAASFDSFAYDLVESAFEALLRSPVRRGRRDGGLERLHRSANVGSVSRDEISLSWTGNDGLPVSSVWRRLGAS